jgi:hypothetical protein
VSIADHFERFLVPEAEISLKVIFDNVRNYLICGALLGMALWLQSGKAIAPPVLFAGPPTKVGLQLLFWTTIAIFGVLFTVNACQSYVIGRRLLRFLDEAPSTTAHSARMPRCLRALIWLIAFVLTNITIVIVFGIATVAIYFPWFAAVGSRT